MFKVTISCEQEEIEGELMFHARVDRFPDVHGYDEDPVMAVAGVAESVAELWFTQFQRPPEPQTSAQEKS